MSTTLIVILGLSALALIIAVILAAGEGRPRITQITRTVRKDNDKPKNGDE
jgi:preprotein translocase subunit SecG